MNPVTVSLTFCMFCLIIFFMILPVGLQRDENPQIGNAISAPKNANIGKKAIITIIISAILTFTFFYLMVHGYLDFLSPRE